MFTTVHFIVNKCKRLVKERKKEKRKKNLSKREKKVKKLGKSYMCVTKTPKHLDATFN